MTDVDTLARTVWAEARGEGLRGMIAVAASIMNRVNLDLKNDGKPDWWGEGVEGVCRKPWQYSCWNAGDPNLEKLEKVNEADLAFGAALSIAERAVAGNLPDPTGGATHYVVDSWVDRTAWTKGQTPTAKIGRHCFYRLA